MQFHTHLPLITFLFAVSLEVEETLDPLTEIFTVSASDPENDVITFAIDVTPTTGASFSIDPDSKQ